MKEEAEERKNAGEIVIRDKLPLPDLKTKRGKWKSGARGPEGGV